MIILLNSSKTLDFQKPASIAKHSIPEFSEDSSLLVDALRKLSRPDFAALMGVSEKLANLNVNRYKKWRISASAPQAKQAILAFKGDIYAPMDVENYSLKEFNFAQKHLRILSGLYGILRPLDLIQPYRLEMATRLSTERGKGLYAFWGDRINQALRAALKQEKSGILINLASLEYFKAVKAKQLDARVVTPVFKEYRDSSHRVVAIFAKKARGMMCDYIIRNHMTRIQALKSFDLDGYRFNEKLSSENEWVFTRGDR
ncbi:MAG: peroxide stress protein YaaA [Deltaproteobacteria bacterium]|jgi:cytoplasmic iron level regulating protein YaaA (DUF328/UPF0246 family)|nr:peroxide stress protein YaaA [Deltaproteobacteria bacterium]